MSFPSRRTAGLLLAATTAVVPQLLGVAPALAADASPLPPGTSFYVPRPVPGAQQQIADLTRSGHKADADRVRAMVQTPQAVWFSGGTPKSVQQDVRQVAQQAAGKGTVPVFVIYNVPGRDCSQYSSGGAGSDAAYRAWVDGFAAGLAKGQKAIVVVEPDGLANLPSDCPGAYPGQDVAALTAGRIADIRYAATRIMQVDPNALVYLDAGHSAWHSVGDMATRLRQAGVEGVRGFSLNVSNYQWSANLEQYGTWVSECLALLAAGRTAGDCGDQYWSGGPANGWQGVALDPMKQWSDTATDPTANTAGINSRYAAALGSLTPSAHFVLDTSRNGTGPWAPAAGTSYPDPQTWCNPPGRGLGPRPQAQPDPGNPLLDAYLWIKTPGQSDGQCNRGIAGSTTDPEWGGITDPAAGAWFPQQALELVRLAQPPLA